MKRNTKKGFTLVELVIVIAVIAILAAVLIPTFGGIIEKAQKSAALQEARNEYAAYLMEHAGETNVKENVYVLVGEYIVEIKNGAAQDNAVKAEFANDTVKGYTATPVYKCEHEGDETHGNSCEYFDFYTKNQQQG